MYDHNISGWNLLNMIGQTQGRGNHGFGATRVIPCSSLINYHRARTASDIIIEMV